MNKIIIDGKWIFDDKGEGNGKLLDGSFFVENSLVEDELSIDTLDFTVRYPITGPSKADVIDLPYGTPATYEQNGKLFGKYFLKSVERLSKYEYSFHFQSAIGLLDDTTHYGGVYQGATAESVIAEIINGKIDYSIHKVFKKIKLYGWLPVGTRRENLKQVLFACAGCVRKDDNGNPFIVALNKFAPTVIPDKRVLEGGKIDYNNLVNQVDVVEHGYIKSVNAEVKEVFKGEVIGSSFTTPAGYDVSNASIVTWDEPHYDYQFEGCSLLNGESDANYAVITASPNAVIKGKPYFHTEAIITRKKPKGPNEKEKIATVNEATLISLANSASTAERVLEYFSNAHTMTASIVLDGEQPTSVVSLKNTFDEMETGFVKNIDGNFGSQIETGDMEVVLNYDPPIIPGSRDLESIEVYDTKLPLPCAEGEVFDPSRIKVRAVYDDGSTANVSNIKYSPTGPLQKTDTEVIISYTEYDITKTTAVPVRVMPEIDHIELKYPKDPSSEKGEGDSTKTNATVTAFFKDGTSTVLLPDEYSMEPEVVGVRTMEATAIYHDSINNVDFESSAVILRYDNYWQIKDIDRLKGFKETYLEGEPFSDLEVDFIVHFSKDPRGLDRVVLIKSTVITPKRAEFGERNFINVRVYSGEAILYTTDYGPYKSDYIRSIRIVTPPNKTDYYEGDIFQPAGLVLEGTLGSGEKITIPTSEIQVPQTPLIYGQTTAKVQYYRGVYKHSGLLELDVPITVDYYPYDFTKSIVITKSGKYSLKDIGATHRNLRIVCIQGGNGGTGGSNGGYGYGADATYINSGETGTKTSQPGRAGQGGKGGPAVIGGMFYATDITLDTPDTLLDIKIGAGGQGGATVSNGYELNAGTAGGETTCSIDGLTITSGSGSTAQEGFTDIFTQKTYALPAPGGEDASAGGNGGNYNSAGSNGTSQGEWQGGYPGQPWSKNTPVDYLVNPPVETKTDQGSQSVLWPRGDHKNKMSGYSSVYINSKDGSVVGEGNIDIGYIETFTGEYTPIGSTETQYHEFNRYHKSATIYTDVENDNVPQHANGTYYSRYNKVKSDVTYSWWGNSTWSDTEHVGTYITPFTVTRKFVYIEEHRTLKQAIGGGGGGGATATSHGHYAPNGHGGAGGNAGPAYIPPADSYGSSGGSGSGGGGGGGAGGTLAGIEGKNTYKPSSVRTDYQSGGSGGSGSAGANGNSGCVIIYYS